MANDWIKMRVGLRTNPRTIAMARWLAKHPAFGEWGRGCVTFSVVTRVTVAALHEVWSNVNDSITEEDFLPGLGVCDLDEIAGVPGIGQAMEQVGWVVADGAKGLRFPNFHEHNTPAKVRTNAERQRAYRERKRRGVRVTLDKSKSKSKSNKKPLNPLGKGKEDLPFEIPNGWDSERTLAAIAQWTDNKRGRGQAYKGRNWWTIAVKEFATLEGFTAAVERSILNNWAGLFATAAPGKPAEPDTAGKPYFHQTDAEKAESARSRRMILERRESKLAALNGGRP